MTTIFIGAIIVGLILGLLGSGGSAIMVPILVYMVGHDAKISIAESMAIVGERLSELGWADLRPMPSSSLSSGRCCCWPLV